MTTRPLATELLNRREALLHAGALLGGAMVGSAALLSGCATRDARPADELFSGRDVELLDWIAETILPATDTPGAMAAGVGVYMTVMVADTYTKDEQDVFRQGLGKVERMSLAEYGTPFVTASAEQRTALLVRLDAEQHAYMQDRRGDEPVHYFRMLKELTLSGYFTSEIGYYRAMRYVETPGRFDPCVPYAVGDRAWAPHA